MATIGTFTKTENGFTGTVKTLSLNVKREVRPAEGDSARPRLPHLRRCQEFGAAWKKTRETQREYLSVKLDDPSFPRRSMPAWSRPRAARDTTSSGLAATAIEANGTRSPAHERGSVMFMAAPPIGNTAIRMVGLRFCGLHILIGSPASAGARRCRMPGRCPRRGARDR